MPNRNQYPNDPHPFSLIVPDCQNEIFKFYLQKMTPSQMNDSQDRNFYKERVVCWEFAPECENVVQFLRETMGQKGHLFYVDLAGNEHLTKEVFPLLRGVSQLDLSYCRCLDNDAMTNLRQVRKLCLRGVDSKKMTSQGFSNLRNCVELDISECSQDTIGDEAFENLRNLRVLQMAHCFQESITDAAFTNLRNCVELDISGCHQATITSAAFENLRNVRQLKMINMYQTSIGDKAFENLRNCLELDMSGCKQATITSKAFNNLRNLHVLRMFACDQAFNVEIFRNFDNLEELDMRMCSDKLLQVWMEKFVLGKEGTVQEGDEQSKMVLGVASDKVVASPEKRFLPVIDERADATNSSMSSRLTGRNL